MISLKQIYLTAAMLSLTPLFAVATNPSITVGNDLVEREITIQNSQIFSTTLSLTDNDTNFIKDGSKEFSFLINDQKFTGRSKWEIVGCSQNVTSAGVQETTITLEDDKHAPNFRATINYNVFPGLPLIRKWIDFENIGNRDLKIESVDVENLQTSLYSVHTMVYNNYGRMKHLMKYEGDWDDAVAVIHNIVERSGIAMGNEAPTVLKRSAYHTDNDNLEIGLTHKESSYPFRKWLTPSQKWSTPKTFICLYEDEEDGFQVINNDVNRFVTNHMENRITQLENKPTFVYNTWTPFRCDVNEALIKDVAKAASDCGIQEFVIDVGWQRNIPQAGNVEHPERIQDLGDWIVDEVKFPNGLKHTFDYIKSLGMKPGLWISLATVSKNSKIYKDHPEWFVEGENNEIVYLHTPVQRDDVTASFGTEWKNYIRDVILGLVEEYGLEYAKLDLAVVTSPYHNVDSFSGSYSKNHPDYRDRPESFIVLFENLLELFDELHAAAPNLFIDCTYETTGKVQLMDYAIAQHAEGNWLSNFEGPAPSSSLRVRHMAWWRSPALPASSLVIGNMVMDDPEFELILKSMIGTLPIVLGDPRKLNSRERSEIKRWADWIDKMQTKHNYMKFRKDLEGFGEPKEGYWDGWQRLNFNNNEGGLFGVFRQGGHENHRVVVLDDLQPDRTYNINIAPSGKRVYTATGAELMNKGVTIELDKEYDGDIFEVTLATKKSND